MIVMATIVEWVSAIATAFGVLVAAFALFVASRQLGVAARQLGGEREATEYQGRNSRGEFLLGLDQAFRAHDTTHRKFRPATGVPAEGVGIWYGEDAIGPRDAGEWADVEACMGLFERVNLMIDDELLDPVAVRRLRGYRIANIQSNPKVMAEKLLKRSAGWQDFIALSRRLDYWQPDGIEDAVRLDADRAGWESGTYGLVVGHDVREADVAITDSDGETLAIISVPHSQLTPAPRRINT
jgi:hypothetical protein